MFHLLPSIRSSALVAGFAIALAAGTGSALAGPAQRNVTVIAPSDSLVEIVNHADLNLATSASRGQLMRRVGSAVHRVCAMGRYQGGLSQSEQTGCEEAAWTDAKPQIALAVERATQIARNGFSTLPEVALTVSAPASAAL